MRAAIRWLSISALAITFCAGSLAPGDVAGAATLDRVKTVEWSPSQVQHAISAGTFHRFGVVARFYTPRALQYAVFTIHFGGGLSAYPGTTSIGTAAAGMHNVAFIVSVPAATRTGSYLGTGHLLHRQGRQEVRIGPNFYVVVRVVGGPKPKPHPRPTGSTIRWQPTNSHGALVVQQGQAITETASFRSARHASQRNL